MMHYTSLEARRSVRLWGAGPLAPMQHPIGEVRRTPNIGLEHPASIPVDEGAVADAGRGGASARWRKPSLEAVGEHTPVLSKGIDGHDHVLARIDNENLIETQPEPLEPLPGCLL